MKNWKKKKREARCTTNSKIKLRPSVAIIHQIASLKMKKARALCRAVCAISRQMIVTNTMIFFHSEAILASYPRQAMIRTTTLLRNQSTLRAKLQRFERGQNLGMNKPLSAPIKCKTKQMIVSNQHLYLNKASK